VTDRVDVSVVVPAYNEGRTIGENLQALAEQTFRGDWEVIVADNGSTDDTREIVRRFMQRFPRLRLIEADGRQGAAHARNRGVEVARGDCILFVDADDVPGVGWVAALREALDEYDLVASRWECERLNPPGEGDRRIRGCAQAEGLQQYRYPPYLPHSGGCGLGVRRKIHEEVGGFDESMRLLEDTDYCWRIQLTGHSFGFADKGVVHIRFPDDPRGALRQARTWGEFNVLLYKKYRPQGMPKLNVKEGLRAWMRLIRRLPRLRHADVRPALLWQLNWRYGRLKGCIKHRVLAL